MKVQVSNIHNRSRQDLVTMTMKTVNKAIQALEILDKKIKIFQKKKSNKKIKLIIMILISIYDYNNLLIFY